MFVLEVPLFAVGVDEPLDVELFEFLLELLDGRPRVGVADRVLHQFDYQLDDDPVELPGVVELLVELMEHAISHADAGPTVEEFERKMAEFDVEGFVDAYREQRDFEDEHDTAV